MYQSTIRQRFINPSHNKRTIRSRFRKIKCGCPKHPITFTKVKYLKMNPNVKSQRAGVILYCVHEDNLYFGLALDSKYHELTDFGGNVNYNHGETVVEGALREFHEETLNIFQTFTIDRIDKCPVFFNYNNLIIFVRVDNNPEEISQRFLIKYDQVKNIREKENCAIVWIHQTHFLEYLTSNNYLDEGYRGMYNRVRNFLNQIDNITKYL